MVVVEYKNLISNVMLIHLRIVCYESFLYEFVISDGCYSITLLLVYHKQDNNFFLTIIVTVYFFFIITIHFYLVKIISSILILNRFLSIDISTIIVRVNFSETTTINRHFLRPFQLYRIS